MPRYMLLQYYAEPESGCPPMSQWSPEEVQAHIDFQITLNEQLTKSGEFVDAQGLAVPDQAKVVVSDGTHAPVVTDGPYPEGKELLAGYRIIDVDSLDRALEIAATASAAPAMKGEPIRDRIEVRQIMQISSDEW